MSYQVRHCTLMLRIKVTFSCISACTNASCRV